MTIEDRIQTLLAQAAPLRVIPEDDPAHAPLAGIVDEINRLREMQADGFIDMPEVRRKPGRPSKASIEGADAA